MRSCLPLLLLALLALLLCELSTFTLGASVGKLVAPAGIPRTHEQCDVKNIKSYFDTQQMLLRLKVHRQRLLIKRLRYQIYLLRMRHLHEARVHRQILQFKHQVDQTKRAFKRKLASVTMQYHPPSVPRYSESKPSLQSKNKKSIPLLALSPKVPLRRIRLGARKSVDQKIKKLKRNQDGMRREVNRILTFRHRIYRIRKHQAVLRKRIKQIVARNRKAGQMALAYEAKRQRLLRQLTLAKNAQAAQSVVRRLTSQINRFTGRIKSARKRQVRMRQRIARILSRQHRMKARVALLRSREEVQLQEGRTLYARATRLLAKWNVFGPSQLGQIIKGFDDTNAAKSAPERQAKDPRRREYSGKHITQAIGPKSRAEVRRVTKIMAEIVRRFRHQVRKILLYHRQMVRLRKRTAKLERQSSKQFQEVKNTGGKNRVILKLRIAETTGKLEKLKTKAANASRKRAHLFSGINEIGLEYRKFMIKYNLQDILRALNHGYRESIKVKSNIRRREREGKQLASEQKRLLHRINAAHGISKRKVKNLIRLQSRRIRGFLQKRAAKRIKKRIARFEKRQKLEAEKVAIIQQRRQHIEMRRASLNRRARRIAARLRRLRRRILAREIRRRLLLRKVERLRGRRRLVLRLPNDQSKAQRIHHIDVQLAGAANKIGRSGSRINALKQRRHRLKARMHQYTAKWRRFRKRMAANQRRARHQVKQLQRLAKKKRQFVKRVVKRKLVSRRKMKRLFKGHRHSDGGRSSRRKAFKSSAQELSANALIRKVLGTLRVHASTRASIEQIIGNELLRVSKTERIARQVLRSRTPTAIKQIGEIRHHLRQRLSALKRALSLVKPAFEKLVQQEKNKQQIVEKEVQMALAKSVSRLKRRFRLALKRLERVRGHRFQVLFNGRNGSAKLGSPSTGKRDESISWIDGEIQVVSEDE